MQSAQSPATPMLFCLACGCLILLPDRHRNHRVIPYTKPLEAPEPTVLTEDDLYGIDVDKTGAVVRDYGAAEGVAHIPTVFTIATDIGVVFTIVPTGEPGNIPWLTWRSDGGGGWVADSADEAFTDYFTGHPRRHKQTLEFAMAVLFYRSEDEYRAWLMTDVLKDVE